MLGQTSFVLPRTLSYLRQSPTNRLIANMSIVTVSGLSADTTRESIEAFFSFCGTINKVELADKVATVIFAAPAGASNAVL